MRYVSKNPPGGGRNPYQLIDYVHQWRCFVHEVIFLTPIKASSNILQEVVMEETKKTKLEI